MSVRKCLTLCTGMACGLVVSCLDPPTREIMHTAPEKHAGFADNAACVECHRQEAEQWRGSHHDLAMQVASRETVLGDFDGATFSGFGIEARFFRRDSRFLVNTEGPDGRLSDFEISYVFGVEPLQQYLIEFPGGRLQCLTIAWDTKDRRWFHLYPDERIEPDDPLHWTGRYQNWNLMCAECHTTDYQKGYDLVTDSYQSSWKELNVSCQACHGPGEEHVNWARSGNFSGSPERSRGLKVHFKQNKLDSRYEVDSCAPCHSRRSRFSDRYPHYGDFHDHFRLQALGEGLYFEDGQIREEVYVYGSFLQSRMYAQGVSCTDCHDSHSLRLKKKGNDLCTQCHRAQEPVRNFEGLKRADYDSAAHHFHLPAERRERQGTECVSCHMPERTYMIVDPRRDHSFRVPRPDLSVKLGVPNACTQCHSDRSDRWAADRLEAWYGPDRGRQPHYGEAIRSAINGEAAAATPLGALISDLDQPAIVRATALDLSRNYGASGLESRLSALQDESPLVRGFAARGLEFLDPQIKLDPLVPALEDPTRMVRMEAARVLASVPAQEFGDRNRSAFRAALREFTDGQKWLGDMPASHFNLGFLEAARGDLRKAEESYRRTLRMDPAFLPAYLNLANLYNSQGRNPEAEKMFRHLIARAPEEGEAHYSLGLLMAEMGRLDEARTALAAAVRLLPNRPRVRYNYALTLQHLGVRAEAERVLREAHALNSEDTDIVYALAVFYVQERQWDQALLHARKLQDLVPPGAAGPQRLIDEIESQMNRALR